MAQYWWHRTCHNVPLLYNLHRPHHEAEYMSIRIVFRNNPIYFLLMPGLYFSGILVFLGGLKVYAFYIIIKQVVIFGAHTDLRWDKKLYEIKFLQPLMWLLERTISTPATHWAHHGKHMADPATHYKGNYGNLLFLWDIIFGTAKITRKYPQEIGVENLNEASAAYQILWPFVKAPEKNQ
jgi:sterol desaturase/sphingolipid hydroxylase (fatty acid hydroxylase superfamily)